ncbi:hypothetical protein ACCO45_007463 [Purpureocillium lilacinum]|uniref:Uncharacterized protein n=1 Tax=Purpureocillium lilacinum TaxID=33203 RepID=A0ACC4DSQ4_PURLI
MRNTAVIAAVAALASTVYTLDRRGYRNDFKGPGFMWPYCYETTPAGTAEPTGTAGAGSEDLPTPAGPVVTPVSNQ